MEKIEAPPIFKKHIKGEELNSKISSFFLIMVGIVQLQFF